MTYTITSNILSLFILQGNPISDLSQFFTSFGQGILNALPRIILVIVLLIVGWIIAKIVGRIILSVGKKVKIDKISDQLKEIDLFSSLDIKFSDVLSKLAYWGVFLVFILAASEASGLQAVTDGISSIIAYIPRLLVAVIFFVVGSLIANMIRKVLQAALEASGITISKLIATFIFYFIMIMVIITSLNQAGLDTKIITQNVTLAIGAIMFAFAIGYGFASRDIMASILASMYSRNKFKIGQHISIDDIAGEIIDKDSTSVTIQNVTSQRKIVIPLSKLISSVVEVLD